MHALQAPYSARSLVITVVYYRPAIPKIFTPVHLADALHVHAEASGSFERSEGAAPAFAAKR